MTCVDSLLVFWRLVMNVLKGSSCMSFALLEAPSVMLVDNILLNMIEFYEHKKR